MIPPVPGTERLLSAVQAVLRTATPLVIGVNGGFGSGAPSIALWLGWQLCIPIVHSDLFVVRGTHPIKWRLDELKRVVFVRLQFCAPVIVEGLCLCRNLREIDCSPDHLVWVEHVGVPIAANDDPTGNYVEDFRLDDKADYRLRWNI